MKNNSHILSTSFENTLTKSNYPIAIQMRVTLVYKVLNDFYRAYYKQNLEFPGIIINSEYVSTYSHLNIINTNFQQLSSENFSDIWITLAIAHEMWHILSHKVWYIDLSKPLNLEDNSYQNFDKIIARAWEKIADTIAGFVLKKLEDEGYTIPQDIENALTNFEYLWTSGTVQSFFNGKRKTNIHWTGPQRKERIKDWHSMSDDDLYNYLNSSILPTYTTMDIIKDIKESFISIFTKT